MKKTYAYILGALVLFPQFAFAASCSTMPNDTLAEIISRVICFINSSLIPFGFALATLFFIYGVVSYVVKGDDEEARKKGREFIVWGIIAMFVLGTIFGLVALLADASKLRHATDTPIEIPEAPTFTP